MTAFFTHSIPMQERQAKKSERIQESLFINDRKQEKKHQEGKKKKKKEGGRKRESFVMMKTDKQK